MDPFDPPLDTARHLRYWQRCARSLLPHHYTSMDSTRLSLAFFIICAIDLLTPSSSSSSQDTSSSSSNDNNNNKPLLTPADRRSLRRWVLSCQHPLGGFVASPTHAFRPEHQHGDAVEEAHLGGTYFALLLLALLADDDSNSAFAGVDRVRTLRWLRRLQRPEDGSFGESVYDPPMVGGGKDMRYCYLAAAVRWMLRGDLKPDDPAYVEDIDIPALLAHIRRSQTYDGGFAESWRQESHCGYGYCASEAMRQGIPDKNAFISWLTSRHFVYLPNSGKQDNDHNDDDDDPETANFLLADLSLADENTDPKYIGFNGRCNKIADTCYTWWTIGSLAVLGAGPAAATAGTDPATLKAQRLFLLEKTQHAIGGFGKHPGAPPDVGHGCLGLAALATMGDPSLKTFDPALCISVDAVRRVERARRGLLRQPVAGEGDGEGGERKNVVELRQRLVETAVQMGGGERPEWLDAMA
ncbi:hypothetical protein M406DRAFT_46180 [Cryphonectria parasitica EP155]|uniref:Prenyltransferase alpha-alpha toroid domain-containing protein n=1 Tax=Cryphonectria parasitica (strain ATCC 38755 / EP155) TaxID=660469 RepID=A0A9P4XXF0_CRYP1|nr:uncharacterized protein M406DRAFT_46180 [Cryphonectria parasitica EP155]KAF3762778.1 hypothetical protein M406DRAFT_46180 [Cryphonectria parasitica EP155]